MKNVNEDKNQAVDDKYIEKLLSKKYAKNVNDIAEKNLSLGDKVADKIADVAGSWPFIIGFLIFILIWIIINIVQAFVHFDNYPFILLNLALSCIAAIQAPIIMMSQNRQEEKDRIRAEQDFETNRKSEIIIEEILKRLKQLEKNQKEIIEHINKQNNK